MKIFQEDRGLCSKQLYRDARVKVLRIAFAWLQLVSCTGNYVFTIPRRMGRLRITVCEYTTEEEIERKKERMG